MSKKQAALITSNELYDLAHAALNDVEYGDDSDPYVKKIRRIAEKALQRIQDLEEKGTSL